MGRVEPPAEPDLDERDIRADLGEVQEHDRGQQLELGRRAKARRDPVGDRQDAGNQTRERLWLDGPAVDDDPLAIADQVRLGGLGHPIPGRPERRGRQCDHAALAVRTRDEGAAHRQLRIVEGAEQGPDPPEPQPDPEAATVLDRAQGRRIRQLGGGRRAPRVERAHSFVSSSS